jgi:2-dehydropantoate 2-reductase
LNNRFKIFIAGTGAIGGYFGARLTQNPGNDVFFLAREKNLLNLKKNGLVIHSINGNAKLKINVSDNPDSFKSKFDLILISAKSYDTDNLIKQIRNSVSRETIILSLQNGIDNYIKLKKVFGKSRVLQGICRIGVEMSKNSVINHTSLGLIVIGEENGNITKRIKNIQNVFSNSNIKCKLSANIVKEIWVKYGWNCIFNTLTGITTLTTDKLFKDEQSEKIIYEFYSEFKKIAMSQGIILDKDDKAKIIDDTKNFSFRTSMFQDKIKGKKLEYETFTGYLLTLANKNHIKTPLIRTLHTLIRTIDLNIRITE